MAIISILRGAISSSTSKSSIYRILAIPLRTTGATAEARQLAISPCRQFGTTPFRLSAHDGNRLFNITPSRWTWNVYKNDLHFYIMLGAIPCLIGIFLVNVFIGPATLAPIPEGYVPKHWEYYKHPISRFLARYFCQIPQEDYERNIYYISEEEEKRRMRFLAWRVEDLMAYRGDYPNYFNNPTLSGSYMRMVIEDMDFIYKTRGFSHEKHHVVPEDSYEE